METKGRKISERDMRFLANYANTYYPMSDSLADLRGAIRKIEGYSQAQAILSTKKEILEVKLKKAKNRLNVMINRYGEDRVFEIINRYDEYSC